MQKRRRWEEKKNLEENKHEKPQEGAITRENKKKPRTEGGETEKRRRRRAFSNRCLHCYLRLHVQLHQVKSSSSLCFCVIVARKQCEGNLITFALYSARVGWATRAYCPAGSLAWASDLARPSPAQPMLVGLDPTQKKSGLDMGFRPSRPKLCLLRVCLALAIIFMSILVWYLAKQASFRYQKIPKIFWNLCWFICGPLALWFIFFLCVLYFFFSYVLNLWPIIVKCKYVVQCFFFLFPSKKDK